MQPVVRPTVPPVGLRPTGLPLQLAAARRATWLLACSVAGLVAALGSSTLRAQPVSLPPLRPLSLQSAEAGLARAPGLPVQAPRTTGTLDLRQRQVHVAEYLLLFDLSGELPATPRSGRLLGVAVGDGGARLAYRSTPDIAALQALTDQAWADLQARLAAAGVVLADAAAAQQAHGAVHAAANPGSSADAPVVLEHVQGPVTRRYLAFAPTGMRLVPRTAAGPGPADDTARSAYAAQGMEALSLVMALHFSAIDTSGERLPAFAAPGGLPTLSPLMELAPAPGAPLVLAHVQQARVQLAEALVPQLPFGRLRLAPLDGPIPSNDPLKPLLGIGRRLGVDSGPASTRVDALLDLDGAATARLVATLTSAGNQAMADALKAAR